MLDLWDVRSNLSGATTPDQIGPRSNSNEKVLWTPKSSRITGVSPSDYLMPYPGQSMGKFYSSTEMQSVYFAALAELVIFVLRLFKTAAKMHEYTI